MKKKEEIEFWAKQRFKAKQESNSKHHPLISSFRQKADEKYIEILSKYSNKNINHLSINTFPGVTVKDKILFEASQIFDKISHSICSAKIRLRQHIIISNIKIENELNINPNKKVKIDLNSSSNKFKQKLLSAFQMIAMIKPDPPRTSNIIYKYYPLQPMIYSSFINNSFSLFKRKTQFSAFQIFSYSIGTFTLMKIVKDRIKASKKYKNEEKETELFIQDITKNPKSYIKNRNIFSKEEDDKLLKYLSMRENNSKIIHLKRFQNISMLKLLFPLGVVAYQFKSKTTMNISLIPNFFLYYFLTNEVISYANFGLRYLQNKNKIEDKISFFKNNAKYAYTKIINN